VSKTESECLAVPDFFVAIGSSNHSSVLFASWFIALNLGPYLLDHLLNCGISCEPFSGDGNGKDGVRTVRVTRVIRVV
jgi:hypothetical protein